LNQPKPADFSTSRTSPMLKIFDGQIFTTTGGLFGWVSLGLLLLYSTTTGVEKSDLARADFLVLSVTKDTILDISTYGSCIEYFDF
jgi:hypothetical protein